MQKLEFAFLTLILAFTFLLTACPDPNNLKQNNVDCAELTAKATDQGIELNIKTSDNITSSYLIITETNTGICHDVFTGICYDVFSEGSFEDNWESLVNNGETIVFPFTVKDQQYDFKVYGVVQENDGENFVQFCRNITSPCTATNTTELGSWFENNRSYFTDYTVSCAYDEETCKFEVSRNFDALQGLDEATAKSEVSNIIKNVNNYPEDLLYDGVSCFYCIQSGVDELDCIKRSNYWESYNFKIENTTTETSYNFDINLGNWDSYIAYFHDSFSTLTDSDWNETEWYTRRIFSDKEYRYVYKGEKDLQTTSKEANRVLHAFYQFDESAVNKNNYDGDTVTVESPDKYYIKEKEYKTVEAGTSLEDLKKSYPDYTATTLLEFDDDNAILVLYDSETITYTFDAGDGSFTNETNSLEICGPAGKYIGDIEKPVLDGYRFLGWKTEDDKFIYFQSNTKFGEENLKFTAAWQKQGQMLEDFKIIPAVKITGNEIWTPESNIFISDRQLEINSFYMSDHEVTSEEYIQVMDSLPSVYGGSSYGRYDERKRTINQQPNNNPVIGISWTTAVTYCNKLSELEGLTPCYYVIRKNDITSELDTLDYIIATDVICNFSANGYRLPTEAEWEWAARGGENFTYAGSNNIDEVAVYAGNTNYSGTKVVKSKKANAYGLYDMSGSVFEWCWDWYDSISTTTSFYGPAADEDSFYSRDCVQRGGSWSSSDKYCQVSYRTHDDADPYNAKRGYGFRLVRAIK